MKCPICGKERFIPWKTLNPDDVWVIILQSEPMYQFTYPDKKGHISPRCSECYDKIKGGIDARKS